MKHGWWDNQLPDLQIVTNVKPKADTSRAVGYLEAFFHTIAYSDWYLLATFNSGTALRRRDPATNKAIYITATPKLDLIDEVEHIAGSKKPHFDPTLKPFVPHFIGD